MRSNTAVWSRGLSLCIYQLKSLDFVINIFFRNPVRTSNMHAVSGCQEQFNYALPVFNLPVVLRNS